MNANEQIITKEKPHLDDQIRAVRKFESRLKDEVRHVAEMLEKEMTEYIGENVLGDDVLECLYTLVAAAEETQVNLNSSFQDACVRLLKTWEEQDEEQEQEERECKEWQRYESQVNGIYYAGIKL